MDIIAELIALEGSDIYVNTQFQSLGSDEWEFSFIINYLPFDGKMAKRRCPEFIRYESFCFGSATYAGAWTTQAQALEEGIKYAKENILPKTRPQEIKQ